MNTSAFSKYVLNKIRSAMPSMSQTEKTALDAGTVWWDRELMSGDPDWSVLLQTKRPSLSEKEKNFIENGGKLIFPLPVFHVVDKENYKKYLKENFSLFSFT